MKSILIVGICITICNYTLAQSEIEYVFPKKVEKSLTNYFEKNPREDFFLVLDKKGVNDYLLNVGYLDGKPNGLLEKSNRFVQISGKKIPIILNIDYAFVAYGMGPNGEPVRHYVIHEGYTINFTYYGEVLSEGY